MNIKKIFFCLFVILYGWIEVDGITIKKICPVDEIHKSCFFHEEHVCWVSENRLERVKTSAKRLQHCKSGCYCKKGYVRDFPGGGCIISAGCRNHKIRAMLENLPLNRELHMME